MSITAQMPTCIPDCLVQKTAVLSIGINLKLFSHPDAFCESCPRASPAWSLHMRGMGLSREEELKGREEKVSSFYFFPLSFASLVLLSPKSIIIHQPPLPLPPPRDHLKGNTVEFMRSGLHSHLLRDWHPRVNDEAISAEYFGVREGGGWRERLIRFRFILWKCVRSYNNWISKWVPKT